MTPEGMVHALEKIHDLLTPGGSLIDIHPFAEPQQIEVRQTGCLEWSEPKPDCALEAHRQADEALEQAVEKGLYDLIHSSEFDFRVYGSTHTELMTFIQAIESFSETSGEEFFTAGEKEVFARAGEFAAREGKDSEVVTCERVHISQLTPR